MKVFLSWSGVASKEVAKVFRSWLPLLNHNFDPYMSEEDIEKGATWPPALRKALETANFGLLILTPDNAHSNWLHFEAGALATSVEEGRVAPILFGLEQSNIQLPFSLFQITQYQKGEMLSLFQSINRAAGSEARESGQLEEVFNAFWDKHDRQIRQGLRSIGTPSGTLADRQQANAKILEEVLAHSRQQSRILSSPSELFGKELLSLLSRLIQDHEAAAIKLSSNQMQLVLALSGRWAALEKELLARMQSILANDSGKLRGMINRFSRYMNELTANVSGTRE
jgi:hypothetical protein